MKSIEIRSHPHRNQPLEVRGLEPLAGLVRLCINSIADIMYYINYRMNLAQVQFVYLTYLCALIFRLGEYQSRNSTI